MRRPSSRARLLGLESLEGRRLLSATQATDDSLGSADAAGGLSSEVGTGIYRQLAVVTKTRLESWASKRATDAADDSLQLQTAIYPQWAPYARFSPGGSGVLASGVLADAADDRLAADESERREFFRISFDATSGAAFDQFDLHLLGPNQIVDVSALPTASGTLRFSQNVNFEGAKCCPARRGAQKDWDQKDWDQEDWGQLKAGDREMTLSAPLSDGAADVSRPESPPSTESPQLNTGVGTVAGNSHDASDGVGGEISLDSPMVSGGNQGMPNTMDGTPVGMDTHAGGLTGAGDRSASLGYAESIGNPGFDVVPDVMGSIDTDPNSTIILGTPGLAIDSVGRAGAGAAVESSLSEGGFVELDLSASLRETDLNAQTFARRSAERVDSPTATSSSSDLAENFPRTLGLFELGLNEATAPAASLTELQPDVPSLTRDEPASAIDAVNDPSIEGDEIVVDSTANQVVTSESNRSELTANSEIDLTAVADDRQASASVDQVLSQRLDDLLGTGSHEFSSDDLAEIVGAQVAAIDPSESATVVDASDGETSITLAHYSSGGMIELANDSTVNSSVPVRPIQASGRPLGIDGSIGLLRGVELSIAGLDSDRSLTRLAASTTSDVFDRLDQLSASRDQESTARVSTNAAAAGDQWGSSEPGRSNESGANLALLRRWAQWGMLAAVPALIWGHRRRSGSHKHPLVPASSGEARRKRES